MNTLRRTLAFSYGFVLMYFVSIWVAGVMAAQSIPREYFDFFSAYGRLGKELAHAFLGVVLHVIPSMFLLGLGVATYALLSRQHSRAVGLWATLGSAVSYCFWMAFYAVQGAVPPTQVLGQVLAAPWWAWPNIAAPLLGLGFAFLLVSRSEKQASVA